MTGRARAYALLLGGTVALLAAATSSLAQTTAPQAPAAAPAAAAAPAGPLKGDPVRGKAISYTCIGCHGISGYKNAYPMYSVPELRGQSPDYLVAALHEYRDGDRSFITMHAQAEELSDQDMADIAAYFAGTPLKPTGKPEGTVPKAAMLCVSCHGQDGVAIAPMYPSLAGQHQDYLVRALDEYKRGGRKNPIMKGFAANLSDEDIDTIAQYFSRLTPSLSTEPRPYSRFTAE
jgi:cytochrome c553